MIGSISVFYKKHQRWIPVSSFVLGFIFDMFMLRRIDDIRTIVQQAVYILISASIIGVELIESTREIKMPGFFRKIWKYEEAVLHFLLGTLLNSYTIFYFKSASAITSFIFIILLVALLTINEFKKFEKSQTKVHVALLSLCVISYLVSLMPIILGFMGTITFSIALIASLFIFWFFYRFMKKRLEGRPNLLLTHVVQPYVAIQVFFSILYFAHAIPPVPLSVKYMGIYHQVEKSEGEYRLTYFRPDYRFWEHGDQTFYARPGDSIFCYVQIFSPTRFQDQLQVRWLLKDEKRGWQSQDAIKLSVTGGREEGFRAVTKKDNYQPGEWRVQIETLDGREIGRIDFVIIPDTETNERMREIELK
jgi:hypothetical protein